MRGPRNIEQNPLCQIIGLYLLAARPRPFTTRRGRLVLAMLTKTLAWLVISLFVMLIVWWWLDPVGFSQNPVITWFKGLHSPLPERLR